MAFMDSIFEEPSEEDVANIQRIQDLLPEIPDREADFIELYYFRRKRQVEIAKLFQVSQPTVCYRLQRACSRIQFLMAIPKTTEKELRRELGKLVDDPKDVNIMVGMWKTTCQSAVAKDLGVSQGLVRHRFLRTVKKLKAAKGQEKLVKLFEIISDNLNILREVQRPTWDEKAAFSIL